MLNVKLQQAEILLLSTYELGHQPLSLAWPLAALKQAGLEAQAYDLSIEPFPRTAVQDAKFVGVSVPMHTALRLGVQTAQQVRVLNPDAHICFYGLYAWLNAEHLLDNSIADSIIAGEYEEPLVTLVSALVAGRSIDGLSGIATRASSAQPHLARIDFPGPDRAELPNLSGYAHYTSEHHHTPTGYVEASRGCLHICRHCPVVPVYQGRFFVVPLDTVLADVRQQVAAGAGHITFGDPDFLNGPGHALKIARALNAEFPTLTFNFTAKVAHIHQHRDLMPEFKHLGCTFIVSAFEASADHILERLAKGHTLLDMGQALEVLAGVGIAVQPTWMPFTPWTSLDDYLHLLGWIREHDLIPNVPPVQLSVRMLIPPNSGLLNHPDTDDWLGNLDAPNFSYTWTHPDPRMDELHQRVFGLAEQYAGDDDHYSAFSAIEQLAYHIAGIEPPRPPSPANRPAPPRLTEHWFC